MLGRGIGGCLTMVIVEVKSGVKVELCFNLAPNCQPLTNEEE